MSVPATLSVVRVLICICAVCVCGRASFVSCAGCPQTAAGGQEMAAAVPAAAARDGCSSAGQMRWDLAGCHAVFGQVCLLGSRAWRS